MAQVYSLGVTQTNIFTAMPIFEIVMQNANYAKIMEISLSTGPLPTAQVTTVGIGVPAVAGSSSFNSFSFAPDNSTIQRHARINTAWGVVPTAPNQFYRRGNLHSVAGLGGQLFWKWPKGLTIDNNTTMVIWCITSATQGTFIYGNIVVEM